MKTPRLKQEVVWRFKENKGWQTGFVTEVMAAGKVVRICDNVYASGFHGSLVSLDDIEWHPK